jgi:hypothetical protein
MSMPPSMPPGPDPNRPDPNAPYPYQPPADQGYGAPQSFGPGYGPGYDPQGGQPQWEQGGQQPQWEQPYDSTYQMSGPPGSPGQPVDPVTGMPMSGMPMSGVPMSTAPMQMPPPGPPPPTKSNTGLLVGLLVGGGALVVVIGLLVVFGLVLHARNSDKHHRADGTTFSSSASQTPSASPTPSPSPTARDVATLDSSSTDQTPFTQEQIFSAQTVQGDDGTTYTLKSAGAFSACSDSGDASTQALMKAHNCGNMMVGVYSNDTAGLLVSTMVLALPDTASVSAIKSGLDGKGDAWNGLSYYCPKSASYYSTVCGSTPRRWWGVAQPFHRYLIISMALLENGSAPTGTTQQNEAIDAVTNGVEDAIPVIH